MKLVPDSFFSGDFGTYTRKYDSIQFSSIQLNVISQNVYNDQSSINAFELITVYRVYQKKVIAIWSALARSLYNLHKLFFHSRKDQAF